MLGVEIYKNKWINKNFDIGDYIIILQEYIAELYEYKIENYSNKKSNIVSENNYNFTFNRFKENKKVCGKIIAKSDKILIDKISNNTYKYSCDILSDILSDKSSDISNNIIDNDDIVLTNIKIKKLYETIYLKENSKTR